MYLLLNGGKHPFFVKGETGKEYAEKLACLKQENIKLDDKFS